MVMSHNLHNNLGNWCIFPENLLIYQGKLVEAANSLRRRNNESNILATNTWFLVFEFSFKFFSMKSFWFHRFYNYCFLEVVLPYLLNH